MIHGIDDLVHVLGHNQAGQVHHCGSPHARAQVSGTSREKAQFTVIGVADRRFNAGIECVDALPDSAEVQARPQNLNAQMILLVDHDATVPVFGQNDPGTLLDLRKLGTDQMLLDQNLAVQFAQVIDFHGKRVVQPLNITQGVHALGQNGSLL